MNRYSYQELREAALSPAATQENINALGEWFERYGHENPDFWNGEYWDADDGMRLFPVYTDPDEYGDSDIIGYEFR